MAVVVSACGASASDVAAEPDAEPAETTQDEPAGAAEADEDDAAGEDDADGAQAPEATSPEDAEEGDGPTAAVEALDFRARLLAGGEFDGRDLAGDPVVLWMWAPW